MPVSRDGGGRTDLTRCCREKNDRPCRTSPRWPLRGQRFGVRILRREVARGRLINARSRICAQASWTIAELVLEVAFPSVTTRRSYGATRRSVRFSIVGG